MYVAKSTVGHKMYEEWRVLDDKINKSQASEEEKARHAELTQDQKDLYGEAFQRITRKFAPDASVQ